MLRWAGPVAGRAAPRVPLPHTIAISHVRTLPFQ